MRQPGQDQNSNLVSPVAGGEKGEGQEINIKSQIRVTDPKPLKIKPSNKRNTQIHKCIYLSKDHRTWGGDQVGSQCTLLQPLSDTKHSGIYELSFQFLTTPFS